MFEGVNTQRFRGGRLGRANSVKFANSDKNWPHFFIWVIGEALAKNAKSGLHACKH